jgi:CDGSH-type Zn-finger protein/uncharacterized Fe-S cluster protein YjdI
MTDTHSPATATVREELIARLSEAAEVEHTLMCVYLYAAFSLKDGEADGLTAVQAEAVARWRAVLMEVAREEMAHLLLVSNLLTSVGGSAHFGRMNFPIPPGMLPADMTVLLAPFDRNTVQHLVWLERPEGVEEAVGAGFEAPAHYQRGGGRPDRLMPHAFDYPTVGALYRQIEQDLDALAGRVGEPELFTGDPAGQIGADLIGLPGVTAVRCLKTAHEALQGIVLQGEGGPSYSADSHYARFCAVRAEYDALLASDPIFVPARPVARNPVMRRPPTPEGKVWIEQEDAAAVVDLANAIYAHMLRLLAQAFGRPASSGGTAALIDASVGLMFALTPVARFATTLPAAPQSATPTAGMSFATLRAFAPLPYGRSEALMLAERLDELAAGATRVAALGAPLQDAAAQLHAIASTFRARLDTLAAIAASAAPAAGVTLIDTRQAPVSTIVDGVERADGERLSILFEARRCIHARFCVTGLPKVFKANVQGPWIDPDAASTEALVGVAHACPSGAIRYVRHDGGSEEAPPAVNIARIRENGPYGVHADIDLAGHGRLFRATLCRCGASKNKPFCDGSHHDIDFVATGEPATRSSEPLDPRGGPLEITPQRNGPLLVRGPLEICKGTGATVDRVTTARLCRCGHSQTKPFCDGTHAKVGFEAQ